MSTSKLVTATEARLIIKLPAGSLPPTGCWPDQPRGSKDFDRASAVGVSPMIMVCPKPSPILQRRLRASFGCFAQGLRASSDRRPATGAGLSPMTLSRRSISGDRTVSPLNQKPGVSVAITTSDLARDRLFALPRAYVGGIFLIGDQGGHRTDPWSCPIPLSDRRCRNDY